ncbi:MICOS complex subunit MIC13-like [Diadema setosum]|uniref:MICOS complex subunit MIC13-like n=1 Tax=Diadema setosum TaxID=31175 RepID=UPI003B3BD787
MAAPVLRTLGKLGVGGGAIYVSVEQGVWGSSLDGAKTMRSLTGSLKTQDEYLRQIPSSEQLSSNLKQGWNSGVKWTFSSLAAGPEKVKELGNQAVGYITDASK